MKNKTETVLLSLQGLGILSESTGNEKMAAVIMGAGVIGMEGVQTLNST